MILSAILPSRPFTSLQGRFQLKPPRLPQPRHRSSGKCTWLLVIPFILLNSACEPADEANYRGRVHRSFDAGTVKGLPIKVYRVTGEDLELTQPQHIGLCALAKTPGFCELLLETETDSAGGFVITIQQESAPWVEDLSQVAAFVFDRESVADVALGWFSIKGKWRPGDIFVDEIHLGRDPHGKLTFKEGSIKAYWGDLHSNVDHKSMLEVSLLGLRDQRNVLFEKVQIDTAFNEIGEPVHKSKPIDYRVLSGQSVQLVLVQQRETLRFQKQDGFNTHRPLYRILTSDVFTNNSSNPPLSQSKSCSLSVGDGALLELDPCPLTNGAYDDGKRLETQCISREKPCFVLIDLEETRQVDLITGAGAVGRLEFSENGASWELFSLQSKYWSTLPSESWWSRAENPVDMRFLRIHRHETGAIFQPHEAAVWGP